MSGNFEEEERFFGVIPFKGQSSDPIFLEEELEKRGDLSTFIPTLVKERSPPLTRYEIWRHVIIRDKDLPHNSRGHVPLERHMVLLNSSSTLALEYLERKHLYDGFYG